MCHNNNDVVLKAHQIVLTSMHIGIIFLKSAYFSWQRALKSFLIPATITKKLKKFNNRIIFFLFRLDTRSFNFLVSFLFSSSFIAHRLNLLSIVRYFFVML